MKREIQIVLYAIIIIAIVGSITLLYTPAPQGPPQTSSSGANKATPNTGNQVVTNTLKISSEELSKHNLTSDCWVAYEGKVYDITLWLPLHPGSAQAISPYCGTSSEFEQAFTGQHGTSQVGKLSEVGAYKGELA